MDSVCNFDEKYGCKSELLIVLWIAHIEPIKLTGAKIINVVLFYLYHFFMNSLFPYLQYTLAILVALGICMFSLPRIILIAKKKKLYDLPDNNRKIHKEVIPNLGGIGIFFSTMIVSSFLIAPSESSAWWHYVVTSSLILFIIGLKDDILIITPAKKFMAQILASVITVVFADVRLHSLHGILGVYEMPYWLSVGFSIVGSTFIINAFNLIDGIDGLAGSIGALCAFSLGIALAFQGNYNGACFAFGLLGGILGFLRYNRSPARIFMGDSGALFIGFSISILSILFINSFTTTVHPYFTTLIHSPQAALLAALSVLFIPVFDSFRVFITRIAGGKHPFHADRTHLHHFLLDMGFSHNRIISILLIANFLIISLALLLQDFNPNIAIIGIFAFSFSLFSLLYVKRKYRLKKVEAALHTLEKEQKGLNVTAPASEKKEKAVMSQALPSIAVHS